MKEIFQGMEYIYEVYKEKSFSKLKEIIYFTAVARSPPM